MEIIIKKHRNGSAREMERMPYLQSPGRIAVLHDFDGELFGILIRQPDIAHQRYVGVFDGPVDVHMPQESDHAHVARDGEDAHGHGVFLVDSDSSLGDVIH